MSGAAMISREVGIENTLPSILKKISVTASENQRDLCNIVVVLFTLRAAADDDQEFYTSNIYSNESFSS